MSDMFDVSDKVVLITGGSRGLGKAMSLEFGRRGAKIVVASRKIEECEKVAEEVRALGAEALPLSCHVGQWDSLEGVIEHVCNRFGRIDVLVNNAAVYDDSSLLSGSYESQTAEYERAIGSCAMGAYYCARACAPVMAAAGRGHIINIITEHIKEEYHLFGRGLGYDCAKFAMWRQVENWARELQPSNIRVNGLCMGATDTPMLRAAAPDFDGETMQPAHIGQAVINALSHGNSGPTGETWLFGPTRTPLAESLAAIEAIGPGGKSA